MSAAQDAASPVGGTGWKGLPGWAKLAAGGATLAAVLTVTIAPGLIGYTGKTKEPAPPAESPPIQAFRPPPRLNEPAAQAEAGPPGRATPTARRLPPPLEIGAYVVKTTPQPATASLTAPAMTAQPAPAAAPVMATAGIAPVGYAAPLSGAGGAAAGSGVGQPDSLAGQVSGATLLAASRARVLAHPDFTITAGAKIPCLPVEAADSSLGGFYTCRVPEWVRGTTQRYGLLPPGTLIFGQVKRGMEQNQERLGILFTRIETSGDHVIIPLAAPGADAMGRPGLDGTVDTFFWDKVGEVALYALIDGTQQAMSAGAAAAVSGATDGRLGLLNLGGGQSLASVALQNRINRPPVLRRDQALPMDVSVGQDLDFYEACRARRQVNAMACPAQ